MSRRICVLAAALVVAAATGCSGDEGDDDAAATTPPATPVSPATTASDYARPEPAEDQSRWARQVDAACEPWQRKLDAVAPPADAAGLDRWLAETLPLVRKQVAAVEAVKPPAAKEDAQQAELFVEDLRGVERALTRYRAALKAGDAEAARQALTDAGTAGAEARAAALAAGVTECGGYTSG